MEIEIEAKVGMEFSIKGRAKMMAIKREGIFIILRWVFYVEQYYCQECKEKTGKVKLCKYGVNER